MTQTLEAAELLAGFRKRKDERSLRSTQIEVQAQRAADLIISFHQEHSGGEDQGYLRDAVTFLCEIASDENPEIARAGVQALFPSLIERLNDSFDPAACRLYDRIFAQVIDFFRRLPQAKELDESLRSFGLLSESDLLARKSRISKPNCQLSTINYQLSKIFLLSRVTIGADVAVTSVLLSKLRLLFPEVEFVLLGPAKLRDLFGGDEAVRVREVKYERGGGVLSRLTSWVDVVKAMDAEVMGLNSDQYWVIDPDSRLTQLGLLPLLKDERNYFFFESRGYQRQGATRLGQLASCWLNEVLGSSGSSFPHVSLPFAHRNFGRHVIEKMRRAGASRVTSISLGVGGNERKRVTDQFEGDLIRRLIADSALILDKGGAVEEREQADRVVASLRAAGRVVVEINERNSAEALSQDTIRADAVTWDGGIGAFAGLIAASDQYVGYDSAGQHIAAALGIPTLTIFVNSGSETFAERWRPYGPGPIKVFNVESSSGAEALGLVLEDWKLEAE